MYQSQKPKLSVCVPVYKSDEALLSTTLWSIVSQSRSWFDVEIIVADDGVSFDLEDNLSEFKKILQTYLTSVQRSVTWNGR